MKRDMYCIGFEGGGFEETSGRNSVEIRSKNSDEKRKEAGDRKSVV